MTRPDGSLTAAFGTLCDLGYIAREDFACCGNCAGYELTTLAEEAIDQGRPADSIRGAVYYHRQDAERFAEGADFYIGYGPLDSVRYGDLGLPAEAVGREVVGVLGKHGVGTEWDGDGDKRIKVRVATVTDPWPALDEEL
jgi:uncharacterized protein DUF6891